MVKPQWLPEPGGLRLEFVFTPVNHGTSYQGTPHGPPSGDQRQPELLADRVLRHLVNGPLSKADLSRSLGQKTVSGQLNKVIRLLLADGSIEYTIPEKSRSRLQMYRLTDQGQEVVRRRGNMDASREVGS